MQRCISDVMIPFIVKLDMASINTNMMIAIRIKALHD